MSDSDIRIPRADKKTPANPDQSKVVSLKRRSTKLVPVAVQSTPDSGVGLIEPGPTQPAKIELPGAHPIKESSMLQLIDRIEQQINKVTNNLMARVEQVLVKLEENAGDLEKEGLSSQEQEKNTFSKLCERIVGALDRTAEDVQGKIFDSSATGQRSIQNVLETGQATIDKLAKDSIDSLLKRSKGLRIEQGQLTQAAQKKFNSLVKQRASDVHALVEMAKSDWEKLTSAELLALEERHTRANDLICKETDSIGSTYDQYSQSLERDVDESWEQSSYEINLTQKQCIAAADETLRVWQQRLILLTKSVIDSDIVPRLKELRDNLDSKVDELRQQFSARYESDRSVQMNEVEAETNELKRQYRLLASKAEASVYDTIAEQQSRISQLFINHRDDIQTLLRNTEDELESIHAQLKKSDATCRKLLISSAATLGLNLATDREKLISNLQELRRTILQAMDDRLQQDIMVLDQASKDQQSTLADCSSEITRQIRGKCAAAIAAIQAEVELTFQEIQKTRERFLL